jgi:hypothetical protein
MPGRCSSWTAALPDEVWRALLDAGNVAVLPYVHEELGGWLTKYADDIAALAISAPDPAIQLVDLSTWVPEEQHAFIYYVQLLSFRKSLYKLLEYKTESALGRDLTEADVLAAKRAALRDFGERAVVLARKAARGDRQAFTFYTDEAVVTYAFGWAIRQQQPVVVLTRDEDLFEQFYKLQWLLDTQYRGFF